VGAGRALTQSTCTLGQAAAIRNAVFETGCALELFFYLRFAGPGPFTVRSFWSAVLYQFYLGGELGLGRGKKDMLRPAAVVCLGLVHGIKHVQRCGTDQPGRHGAAPTGLRERVTPARRAQTEPRFDAFDADLTLFV
jgi:hypothetical protein